MEKLFPEDIPYHKRMVNCLREAQLAQKRIQELEEHLFKSLGAVEEWNKYLREKYELGEKDGVDEEGLITRR